MIELEKKEAGASNSLLSTAKQWFGVEEEFFKSISGNVVADQQRRGYLSLFSLFNLIQLEKNAARKKEYQLLLEQLWINNQNEDNPLFQAVYLLCSDKSTLAKKDSGLILNALGQYSQNTIGYGDDHWDKEGKEIAEKWGAGQDDDYSREPIPISLRPKDSFLWQRNPRRLKGDYPNRYPGTDYLFVYWLCRAYQLF